jgi:hypothetical protein
MLCRLIGHQRSRKNRRLVAGEWRSQCRWCGKPMMRWGHHDWRVDERPDHPEGGFNPGPRGSH